MNFVIFIIFVYYIYIYIYYYNKIMDDVIPVVVIDNGSGYIKAGISGDDAPRATI